MNLLMKVLPTWTGNMWDVVYTKEAVKDSVKIKQSNLKDNVEKLLLVVTEDPFKKPPPYEKLLGDLLGAYSRRINIQHRLIYQVFEDDKLIRILRMWTHYE